MTCQTTHDDSANVNANECAKAQTKVDTEKDEAEREKGETAECMQLRAPTLARQEAENKEC